MALMVRMGQARGGERGRQRERELWWEVCMDRDGLAWTLRISGRRRSSRNSHFDLGRPVMHRDGLGLGLDGSPAGRRGQEAQIGPVSVHAIHTHVVDCVRQVAQGKEADHFRHKSLENEKSQRCSH